MSEHVIVNDEEMVRITTMRRPEKKNTLTQDMYLAMSDAIESAQRNPSIRCLILTGRSGVFTAGVDAIRHPSRESIERFRFGVALHIGEILFGNIGGSSRLDFTCIGLPSTSLRLIRRHLRES
ncbi:enoyl-CoA hydratase-related protein [Bradyrhizobium erythrophlei]|uniref:Enoyl-CoA hydratase/isomerase n=1 Tax=Bradyrhizobium erythrophlei TaxID=1437360 RepID=A0A1H4YVK2_9BRAD|nr:Enoyl-CoA hydratase/isomerase [Bradyrhizobium erythrophlei]